MTKDGNAKNKPDIRNLIDKLAQQEEKFVAQPFLAPAVPGGRVQVKIGESICTIKIAPDDFHGFGIFHPISYTEAVLERPATLAERKKYLELFPSIRLIAARRVAAGWLGSRSNSGDARYKIEGLVPIQLATETRLFDVVTTRFDGTHFWFENSDMRQDPRHADYLRKALEYRTLPDELDFAGLSAEHKAAYEFQYWLATHPQNARTIRRDGPMQNIDEGSLANWLHSQQHVHDPHERRLRESLSHGGASLISYAESGDFYQVTFTVDGRQYSSAVDKESLQLVSAGICLDGLDHEFDLASLSGVLREGMGLYDH